MFFIQNHHDVISDFWVSNVDLLLILGLCCGLDLADPGYKFLFTSACKYCQGGGGASEADLNSVQ